MNNWKQDVQKKIDDRVFNAQLSDEAILKAYLRGKLKNLFKFDNYGLVQFNETGEEMELRVLDNIFKVIFINKSSCGIYKRSQGDSGLVLIGELLIISAGSIGVYLTVFKDGEMQSEKLLFTEQLLDDMLKQAFENVE